jgi:hypothetical protein
MFLDKEIFMYPLQGISLVSGYLYQAGIVPLCGTIPACVILPFEDIHKSLKGFNKRNRRFIPPVNKMKNQYVSK